MSRSSRTCRRAAEVRWTVETHPTLIYCRSRQTVLGSLVANLHQYDLAAPEAADAVAHINDLLRVDGGIVTPIYYWACLNTEIAPSHASSIRKLLDAGADIEKRSTYRGHVDTLLLGLVRQHSAWTRGRSNPLMRRLSRAAAAKLPRRLRLAQRRRRPRVRTPTRPSQRRIRPPRPIRKEIRPPPCAPAAAC